MSENETLTFDEAVALLPDGDEVHTIMDGGFALLGADWRRSEIIAALRDAPEIRITGENAQSTGHGLAVWHPKAETMLFVATSRRTDAPDASADRPAPALGMGEE